MLKEEGYGRGFVLAFAVGFVIRLIPELISFPYPVGWDTVFYAYRVSERLVWGYWDSVSSTWLPYGLMVLMGRLTGWSPFSVLKVVAPLFFGGCSAGVYFVAWKRLGWRVRKSLLASGFFSVQLAALAISWQFHRNVLGVMFLLFAIPFIKRELKWKEIALLSVLSVLVVLSHELAAVSLSFVFFSVVGWECLRGEGFPVRLLVAVTPALTVFLVHNLGVFHPSLTFGREIMWLGDSNYAQVGGLYFLIDYLKVFTPYEHYTGYFDLFFHVSSLFLLLYAWILPLLPSGFFKDKALLSWTGILSSGGFGCLILPFSALLLWNRWMLMLIFPLTFFAVHGLWTALKHDSPQGESLLSKFKVPKKMAIGLALLSVVVGSLFMVVPPGGRHAPVPWGNTFPYIPSTMQRSSIPLQDTPDLTEAYQWLNTRMDNQSCLLSHYVFEFWTLLYLEDEHSAIVFHRDLPAAVEHAVQQDYHRMYLIWWKPEINWYHLQIPSRWTPVFQSNRITVYRLSLNQNR